MIKVAILFLKDEELFLVFLEKVDLFFEVGNDDFFLVGLDFERGIEVGRSRFGIAHEYLIVKQIN